MNNIHYSLDAAADTHEFVDLLHRAGLAARRPVDDPLCINAMLQHTNLLVTAWHDATLIGVARSLTDFHYACYLSDLAVDQAWQKRGIGKRLLELTHKQLGVHAKLILLAAPAANDYYHKLGFEAHPRCWIWPVTSTPV